MCSAKRHSVCFSRMVEGMRGHRQHGWVYGCGWGCDDGTGPLIGVDAGTPGRCCPLREIVAHTGLALLAVAPASWVRASEHQCDCPPPNSRAAAAFAHNITTSSSSYHLYRRHHTSRIRISCAAPCCAAASCVFTNLRLVFCLVAPAFSVSLAPARPIFADTLHCTQHVTTLGFSSSAPSLHLLLPSYTL